MQLLSHYTNRLGLEGIAQSQTIWATNFLDLRDKSEVLFGLVELLNRSLQAALAIVPEDKRQKSYSDADLEKFEAEMYSCRAPRESRVAGNLEQVSKPT
jgi:hypothetical protein